MTVTIDPPPAVQKQPARLFARLLPVVISLAGVGFMAAAFASGSAVTHNGPDSGVGGSRGCNRAGRPATRHRRRPGRLSRLLEPATPHGDGNVCRAEPITEPDISRPRLVMDVDRGSEDVGEAGG